jgi:hypothetical protein
MRCILALQALFVTEVIVERDDRRPARNAIPDPTRPHHARDKIYEAGERGTVPVPRAPPTESVK